MYFQSQGTNTDIQTLLHQDSHDFARHMLRAVKQDGLQDQMLGIVVAAEEPATEEKRVNLVIESAKAKAQLKDLEDKILQLLSSSTGTEASFQKQI